MVVALVWNDARFSHDDEEIRPVIVTTYGVVIHEDEECIRVAGENVGGEYHRGITVVPKGMVLAVHELEYVWRDLMEDSPDE